MPCHVSAETDNEDLGRSQQMHLSNAHLPEPHHKENDFPKAQIPYGHGKPIITETLNGLGEEGQVFQVIGLNRKEEANFRELSGKRDKLLASKEMLEGLLRG